MAFVSCGTAAPVGWSVGRIRFGFQVSAAADQQIKTNTCQNYGEPRRGCPSEFASYMSDWNALTTGPRGGEELNSLD